MTQIGEFTRTPDGYSGRVRTMTLDVEVSLVPVEPSDSENAPNFRVHLSGDDGSEVGPEIGAAWNRNGERAGDYVALVIDDPVFVQPVRANLFQSGDDQMAWGLYWNRPPRRGERD